MVQKELIAAIFAVALTAAAFYASESFINTLRQENVGCVARSTMISRGQSWIDKHVPYNQQGSYDGYRTDCSGYVSMCWELAKPGLTTFTMHEVSHNITKAELLAGDAIICESHHVNLFAGWADSAKSQYVAMEEASTALGTIKRNVPYPYWNGDTCFHPIRFNQVC